MPFKIFQSHKKLKRSKLHKSTTDLNDGCSDEASDHDHKAHSKSILHLFSNSKGGSHVSFKETSGTDKNKNKKAASFSEPKKTRSFIHIPAAETDSDHSSESHSSDMTDSNHSSEDRCGNPGLQSHSSNHLNQNGNIDLKKQPKRSASCGASMDSLGRERRLHEIAQLDNYIEYMRHTEDEGNLANRLCCAQVLKMGFMRLEQMHQHMLQSQERLDANHSQTKRKVSFSNGSQQLRNSQNQEQNLQQNSDRSTHSDDDGPIKFGGCSVFERNGKGSEHESSSDQDSSDDKKAKRGILKKPSCSSAVTKIQALPPDIEIF